MKNAIAVSWSGGIPRVQVVNSASVAHNAIAPPPISVAAAGLKPRGLDSLNLRA